MNIVSPMGRGSGAYIVHKSLSEKIKGYKILGYNPYWTLCPPALQFLFQYKSFADIIHTTPEYGCFFAKRNIPLVLTFHNLVLDNFMQRYSSAAQKIHYQTSQRYFTKKSLAHASAITTVSFFTAEAIRQELNFPGEIRVIYNGIDTEMFSPAPQSHRDTIKVLFSGNLSLRKGAQWLPLIAEKLNKGITILFTSGLRTKDRIPARINLLNIGQIPYSRMPDIYRNADILLFPTVREGFGLAAAEAMACGLPVVATNCSSLPEIVVDGKSGYLCEVGNVDEFAQRINELADSQPLRMEMGGFNRARIEEKFNLQQMIRGYTNLFTEVYESRNS